MESSGFLHKLNLFSITQWSWEAVWWVHENGARIQVTEYIVYKVLFSCRIYSSANYFFKLPGPGRMVDCSRTPAHSWFILWPLSVHWIWMYRLESFYDKPPFLLMAQIPYRQSRQNKLSSIQIVSIHVENLVSSRGTMSGFVCHYMYVRFSHSIFQYKR
jgi:hypothetical protein